ncbi:expansin-A2-like [Lolium rigidum]|uniref:expansin-A2-like n=1 Tax=Lolium rigidum TaxID=89674 RepID=UPI001F5CB107|nr:expansin-A2-like [Lolium rigidum]
MASANALLLLFSAAFCFLARRAAGDDWQSANATSSSGDDRDIFDLPGGACGYGDLYSAGYGTKTATVSPELFNDGAACGACYELKCVDAGSSCLPGSIVVTATDMCRHSYFDEGGWCNLPRAHFVMSEPAYTQIAVRGAGFVPVSYRRAPCVRNGGIRFRISGLLLSTEVLVTNVAGAGDVQSVSIHASSIGWMPMTRMYGQKWQKISELHGQSLSISVTISDGRTVVSNNVAPADWQSGQTFQGGQF